MIPTVLVSTWQSGLFVVAGKTRHRELAGRSVRALSSEGRGGALAIVDGHTLCRRTAAGEWSTIATDPSALACAIAVRDTLYVGTDDARVLRVTRPAADRAAEPAAAQLEALHGFDTVAGRDTWTAGSAVIDGRVVGPPLGIRSMAATADGKVLLANVHVGGIPRSTDEGVTWHPTIEVDSDVHQVCAHPSRPDLVIAATAIGLGLSRDGGASFRVETDGLHAPYCSAVGFSGNDLFVSASTDHFASRGALYHRPVDVQGPLRPVGAGLPSWMNGIVDTDCIATRAAALAICDKAGNLYLSMDAGRNFTLAADGLPGPSSVLIAATE